MLGYKTMGDSSLDDELNKWKNSKHADGIPFEAYLAFKKFQKSPIAKEKVRLIFRKEYEPLTHKIEHVKVFVPYWSSDKMQEWYQNIYLKQGKIPEKSSFNGTLIKSKEHKEKYNAINAMLEAQQKALDDIDSIRKEENKPVKAQLSAKEIADIVEKGLS